MSLNWLFGVVVYEVEFVLKVVVNTELAYEVELQPYRYLTLSLGDITSTWGLEVVFYNIS